MILTYHAQRKAGLGELHSVLTAYLRQREIAENLPHPPDVPLQSMPFDHESSDDEIEAVMAEHVGSEIVWVNSISGRHQEAILQQFRRIVRRPAGRDYMDVLTDQGFHSIYLRRILSIG